jgi:hypothetical protein
MSQPASFTSPRPGEVVLSCRHPYRERGQKAYNISYQEPLKGDAHKDPGLGSLIRRRDGTTFYCRWVVLCWWCRLWSWFRFADPIKKAVREMVWTEGEVAR